MKKYKKIVYLFLLVVIMVLAVLLYSNIKSNAYQKTAKEKGVAEVEYLENKFVTLFNEMNNIDTRNYSISVSEISNQSKEEKNQSSSDSESSSNSESSDSGSDSSSGSSSGSGSEGGNSSNSSTQEENSKKYTLESTSLLTNTLDINWDYVKSEVEMLYSSIPTITLDLYGLNTSQEEILGFNQEFDNLSIAVKEENKENTLKELSKLYEYMPKFISKATDEELTKTVIETKSNLFKAYSILDSKNWTEIEKNTAQTIETYQKLLTNTNIEANKQYDISKVYVMLNELQNAVKMQDETLFLIKYKNILEEINNL